MSNHNAAKKPSEDPAYRGKDVTKWSQRDHNKRVEQLMKKSLGDLMGLKSLIGIELRQNPKDSPSLSLIEMHIETAIKRKKKEKKAMSQDLIEATLAYAKAAGCEKLPPALREQCEKKQNGGKSKSDDKDGDKKDEKSDDKGKDDGEKKKAALVEATRAYEASLKVAARDTLERDAMDIVRFVETALKKGEEGARWRFWPEWDKYSEYYVEVEDGQFWVGGQGTFGINGTDVKKLEQWLWTTFDIGKDRGLSWDRTDR